MTAKRFRSEINSILEDDTPQNGGGGLPEGAKKRDASASFVCVAVNKAPGSSEEPTGNTLYQTTGTVHVVPHSGYAEKADLVADAESDSESDCCGNVAFEGFSEDSSGFSDKISDSTGCTDNPGDLEDILDSSEDTDFDEPIIRVSSDSSSTATSLSDTEDQSKSSTESGDILVLDSRIPGDDDLRILASIVNDPHNGSRWNRMGLSPTSGFGSGGTTYPREFMTYEAFAERLRLGREQRHAWRSLLHPTAFYDDEPLDTFADSDSGDIVFRNINARDNSRYYSADMLFPHRVPAMSQYEGPVRHTLISEAYIEQMAEKVKSIEQRSSPSEMQELIRGFSHLGSVFSREEVYYIREQTREMLVLQEHSLPDLACIITYVYEWACGNKPEIGRPRRHYPSVRYSSLIDTRERQCTVCYEPFKRSSMCAVMDCTHAFHSRCLNLWLHESRCCPTCRAWPKR